ncbi:YcdB/YcdC domain-containing protein [Sutcliffiella cohnii]
MSEDILKRAKSLIQIPSHWSLIIEDYCQPNESAGYTLLSWADEEQNEGISMQLDPKGRLTKLSQERKEEKTDTKPLSDVDIKIIAEQFLLSHYPDALRALTLNVNEKLENKYRFEYVQFVMNLPLPNSGCFIEVSSTGDILEFHYYGVKKEPATPTNFISKEQGLTEIKRTLDFNLVLSTIYAHTYNVKEQGLQLIYEPNPSVLNYRADVFPPTLTINHEEEIPPQYVTLPQQANLNENKKWSIVELIGITDEMEVIREVDMGEEKGVVWQDRNWEEKDRDRTVEGFISRQTEGTVKAIISKNCGKLNSFIWFKERSGNLSLNREQCLQKAIEFIQKTIKL